MHKDSVHLQGLLLTLLSSGEPPPVIEADQVLKHARSLASNKAADIFGVSSEHLKHASPIIIPMMTDIRLFASGKLPDNVKICLATPIPKKAKTQTDPDKFRRITTTGLVGTVIEKHTVHLSKPALRIHQSVWIHRCLMQHSSNAAD